MTALLFLSFSLAVFLEFLFRSHAVPLPLAALLVFYFTPQLGWRAALPLSLIPAAVVGALSGTSAAWELLTFPLVVLLSEGWTRRTAEMEVPDLCVIPGALIPLIVMLPHVFSARSRILEGIAMVLPLMPVCAVLLPLLIRILDKAAVKLGLPPYREAVQNSRKETSS